MYSQKDRVRAWCHLIWTWDVKSPGLCESWPTWKEVFCHPSIILNKMIWHWLVTKYVNEEESWVIIAFLGWAQPCRDFLEERFIILHVFKHLVKGWRASVTNNSAWKPKDKHLYREDAVETNEIRQLPPSPDQTPHRELTVLNHWSRNDWHPL